MTWFEKLLEKGWARLQAQYEKRSKKLCKVRDLQFGLLVGEGTPHAVVIGVLAHRDGPGTLRVRTPANLEYTYTVDVRKWRFNRMVLPHAEGVAFFSFNDDPNSIATAKWRDVSKLEEVRIGATSCHNPKVQDNSAVFATLADKDITLLLGDQIYGDYVWDELGQDAPEDEAFEAYCSLHTYNFLREDSNRCLSNGLHYFLPDDHDCRDMFTTPDYWTEEDTHRPITIAACRAFHEFQMAARLHYRRPEKGLRSQFTRDSVAVPTAACGFHSPILSGALDSPNLSSPALGAPPPRQFFAFDTRPAPFAAAPPPSAASATAYQFAGPAFSQQGSPMAPGPAPIAYAAQTALAINPSPRAPAEGPAAEPPSPRSELSATGRTSPHSQLHTGRTSPFNAHRRGSKAARMPTPPLTIQVGGDDVPSFYRPFVVFNEPISIQPAPYDPVLPTLPPFDTNAAEGTQQGPPTHQLLSATVRRASAVAEPSKLAEESCGPSSAYAYGARQQANSFGAVSDRTEARSSVSSMAEGAYIPVGNQVRGPPTVEIETFETPVPDVAGQPPAQDQARARRNQQLVEQARAQQMHSTQGPIAYGSSATSDTVAPLQYSSRSGGSYSTCTTSTTIPNGSAAWPHPPQSASQYLPAGTQPPLPTFTSSLQLSSVAPPTRSPNELGTHGPPTVSMESFETPVPDVVGLPPAQDVARARNAGKSEQEQAGNLVIAGTTESLLETPDKHQEMLKQMRQQHQEGSAPSDPSSRYRPDPDEGEGPGMFAGFVTKVNSQLTLLGVDMRMECYYGLCALNNPDWLTNRQKAFIRAALASTTTPKLIVPCPRGPCNTHALSVLGSKCSSDLMDSMLSNAHRSQYTWLLQELMAWKERGPTPDSREVLLLAGDVHHGMITEIYLAGRGRHAVMKLGTSSPVTMVPITESPWIAKCLLYSDACCTQMGLLNSIGAGFSFSHKRTVWGRNAMHITVSPGKPLLLDLKEEKKLSKKEQRRLDKAALADDGQ